MLQCTPPQGSLLVKVSSHKAQLSSLVEALSVFSSPFSYYTLLSFIPLYLLRLSQTLILSIRLLTLSKENGRWDSASLMSPSRFPPKPPSTQLQYLMAHSQYSRQNNWNSVSQNHSLITLSTRQEKEGEKRKTEKKNRSTSSVEAVSTHRLLRRPDFFFFLFFGRGDGELLDFLFTLNWPLKGGGGANQGRDREWGRQKQFTSYCERDNITKE